MNRNWIALGAAFALFAVAAGAFGAHRLEATLSPRMLEVFKTGAYYQMIHAIGLILIGQRLERRPDSRLLALSGAALAIGIVLFSGSLYALALTGVRILGLVTPLGGICFMAGWALFAYAELYPAREGGPESISH